MALSRATPELDFTHRLLAALLTEGKRVRGEVQHSVHDWSSAQARTHSRSVSEAIGRIDAIRIGV